MNEVYKKVNKELKDAIKFRQHLTYIHGIDKKEKVDQLREKQDEMYKKAIFKRGILKARSNNNGRIK